MKYCPNCGTATSQGEAFCRKCGTKIPLPQNNLSNATQQSLPSNNQPVDFQPFQSTNSPFSNTQPLSGTQNSQVFQQSQNNVIDDEELIDSYIGKNVDKLKNGKFCFNTLFFGTLYVLYRKMWLLGILWLVINTIATVFLGTISGPITLAANIVISIKFKEYYLKHVKEEIAKIKSANPNKSREELIELCKKKGGTTLVPVIIYVVLIAIFIGVAYYQTGNTINETRKKYNNFQNNNNNKSKRITDSSLTFGDLKVTVPSNFIESEYSTNDLKMYHNPYEETDSCKLNLQFDILSSYNSDVKKEMEGDIFYSASDTYSGITEKEINNNTWYYATVTSDYNQEFYYVIVNNGKIYQIEYEISDDENKSCSSAHDTIVNSLRFN